MNLITIIAFALVFWRAEEPVPWLLVPEGNVFGTLAIALVQPPIIGLATWLTVRRTRKLVVSQSDTPQVAQRFHHRAGFLIRIGLILGFAVTVLLTPWPNWFAFGESFVPLQVLGDLLVLTPFFAGVLVLWLFAYPAERQLRAGSLSQSAGKPQPAASGWPLRSYLDFQARHQVLVVAVPMTLILFAADLVRGYEPTLQAWTGSIWGPDVLLATGVLSVFTVSPMILRRTWRTETLGPGPVRERLEAIADRIGLKFRDILVWNSHGMMVNAAVMGILAPVRYVMLSDALLETMSVRQIEAVFGHEAGHVHHRHIQYFLLFAYVGWMSAVGVMELLARTVAPPTSEGGLTALTVQVAGAGATVVFWGAGFGWLSRRFERQADLFGARSVTPEVDGCRRPCSVHPNEEVALPTAGRVCATGAAVFASSLGLVAALSGIPRDERNWRHSSIGSRIRFLMSLAGDPAGAARFDRQLRQVKIALFVLAVVGSAATILYCSFVDPALLQFDAAGP